MAIDTAAEPPTTRPGCRRFTMADAMIVMAAIGVGMAWGRSDFYSFLLVLQEPRKQGGRYWSLVTAYVFAILAPFLVGGSPAFLIIRLRRPRPTLRRLLRQPGMIASCAATLQMILAAVLTLFNALPSLLAKGLSSELRRMNAYAFFSAGMADGINKTGYVVAGAWLTLALRREWRAEPGWIDSLGRALGIAWIVAIWEPAICFIAWCVGDFILRNSS